MDPITLGLILVTSIIAGAAKAGITTTQQAKDAEENYKKQQKYLKKEKENSLDQLAENYETEKDAVNENATRSEATLNTSARLGFDNLINNMQGQAASYNNANMQIDQNKGNELSQIAASGARSSSMQQAVDLESTVNSQQLQLQQDQTRNNNNYQINSLLANFNSEKANLQASRLSFEEGGTAYRKYQTSVTGINNSYDLANAKLTDEYNAWKAGENSRFMSEMIGGASSTFNLLTSIDTSKINFNSFGSSGMTGELAGNWKTGLSSYYNNSTGFAGYVKASNAKLFN